MAFGDYLQVQRENQPIEVNGTLDGTAIAATSIKAVRSADWTIYVQRIVLSYTTHAAGKVFTIQDSNGTPKVIASRSDLAAAAGVPDVQVWDFGPKGIPLTAGKDLHIVANTGGTGFVGVYHIEGYQKQSTSAIAVASTN